MAAPLPRPHTEELPPAVTAPGPVSNAYRNYALGLLLLVYVLNFVDRQILSILAEPIRREPRSP